MLFAHEVDIPVELLAIGGVVLAALASAVAVIVFLIFRNSSGPNDSGLQRNRRL